MLANFLSYWATQVIFVVLFLIFVLSLFGAVKAHKEGKGKLEAYLGAIAAFLGFLAIVVLYYYFNGLVAAGTTVTSPEGSGILNLIRSILIPPPSQ